MLQPLGDRVIVETLNEEEKTVGGIVLASNAQEKPTTGKVVSVGSGKVLDNGNTLPMSVKVGDVVMFDKYVGTEVTDDGNDYLVLHDSDIVAIVK
ncbi:MAG: co-chaperone GroES [Firmicutes bacterium]|uniref:Co-chaperonin GroES n=1 Tax=Candidatus Gallilactobacillus intestinavium TaxID=2840838 RepID=A0A9D9E532_9LACO|nr:co-chaperone GroES [Candidatus Gallilactobacillus intestinavium]